MLFYTIIGALVAVGVFTLGLNHVIKLANKAMKKDDKE